MTEDERTALLAEICGLMTDEDVQHCAWLGLCRPYWPEFWELAIVFLPMPVRIRKSAELN